MKINEVMTRNVCIADPDQSVRQAAELMVRNDIGSIPVGENDRLIGMLTDRDIVVRAVAEGRDVDRTTVREVMSAKLLYCYDDDSLDDVARNMAAERVRRMPVVNRDKRLVGIVSLANVTHGDARGAMHEFVRDVATPH